MKLHSFHYYKRPCLQLAPDPRRRPPTLQRNTNAIQLKMEYIFRTFLFNEKTNDSTNWVIWLPQNVSKGFPQLQSTKSWNALD